MVVNNFIISSSSSSHDKQIGPLPAKCWPEAFHATLIHKYRESGKTGYDGAEP